jgi:hypothetical protein
MIKRMPLKTGDEYDALTKEGKRWHRTFRAGVRKKVKRAFNKKERRWLDNLLIDFSI